MNKKFYNALNRVPQPVPPIWFMRQAGRYHSHYQGLRKKYSFETLCKNPELAAEVACGPINDFDYDVAILFSDILFPLELFDLQLSYNPGPTFENYLNPEQVKKKIEDVQVEEHLQFQSDAIKITKNMLPKDKSLVGFIGGPWTIISYGLNLNKRSQVNVPSEELFIEKLLYDHLIPILRKNIEMQLDSGAEIVYVFDTNSKQLDKDYFEKKYLRMVEEALFQPFPKKIAYFSKNKSFYDLNKMESNYLELAGTVFSLEKGFCSYLRGTKTGFIQGNFSPTSLLKPHEEFLLDFNQFLEKMSSLSVSERAGWICSLNHGVLPKTPETNVRHFIQTTREQLSSGS
tara:strand:- start:2573 stop:3604 length:1032 start_codon:yes stop_codon:yes gene_type:complete